MVDGVVGDFSQTLQ